MRDAFIDGLLSSNIRQRLLENNKRSLDLARIETFTIIPSNHPYSNAIQPKKDYTAEEYTDDAESNVASQSASVSWYNKKKGKCSYCGNKYHPRFHCPARNAVCHICGVKGHFSKVCNHRDKTIPS